MSLLSFDDLFDAAPVMAILRGYGLERTLEISRSAWELGITCVEVPLQSDQGVGSATDVHNARRLGLRWVKAFPASDLGDGWIRAVRAPFPDMRFVATGGIDASNAAAFLDAGASAVAVGGALSDPAQLPALAELLGRVTA
jgi:2-dehydro-3-deoxyphosphogluconate aldolase/(4S)-4-hydroxy-2-oxoglutarate aldolase